MESIFVYESVADILPKKRPIVSLFVNDSLKDALNVLSTNQILSAPVLDDESKVRGILDMQAVVLFIHGIYPKTLHSMEDMSAREWQQIGVTGVQFENTSVDEVLTVMEKYYEKGELQYPVTMSTPVRDLLGIFHLGVHRCLVMSDDGQSLLGIISQSDLLRIFANALCIVPENIRDHTMKELDLPRGQNLQTIKEDESVLKAVAILATHNVSALPVVNAEGVLVAHFGSSLLRGLSKWNFGDLVPSVKEFLGTSVGEASDPFLVRVQRRRAFHPIVCKESDTFEQTVCRVVAHGVHRVWMVDAGKRPIAAVSIGDLFKPFCSWKIADYPQPESRRAFWIRRVKSYLQFGKDNKEKDRKEKGHKE